MNDKLAFIHFNTLDKWYIEQYLRRGVKGRFPMLSLSKILQPRKERISGKEYNSDIPLVSKIRFSDGKIFYRAATPKNDVFLAHKDDLLVSNINFEKGAFCIVDEDVIACSTDYQPYKIIYNDITPQYLNLCLRCKVFLENVAEAKPKGMKTRAKWEFIKTFSIPVPPIFVQNELVNNYYEMEYKAKETSSISWEKIDEYYASFLRAKNYEYNPLSTYTFSMIDFKKLYRWDSWTSDTGLTSEIYDIVPFGYLILEKPQYGANVKGVDIKCDYRYIRITDINEDGTLNEDIKYPERIEEKYILHENDFLIARSGNTVGKTFLYHSEFGKAVFAGYLVRYILNTNLIIPEYLLYYTKTTIFKNWIAKNQRVAGQPNINGQEYLDFPVILPSLDIQIEMVRHVKKLAQYIRQEQAMSFNLSEHARQDFQQAIFE